MPSPVMAQVRPSVRRAGSTARSTRPMARIIVGATLKPATSTVRASARMLSTPSSGIRLRAISVTMLSNCRESARRQRSSPNSNPARHEPTA
ncbi:Uncharacterised protein [Enterobacter cloacae]|nr:Uncharacterised protein [Enterobacter cloacae]